MTIISETRVAGPFDGNDSTVSFPFTFKVFDSDEVRVVAETGAVETDLKLGTDYTVTLNADQNAAPGGSVVLAAPLATGTRLTLTSALEMLQPVDLTNQGGFYPRVINSALDRLTILLQQLASVVSRTLKFPLSDGPVGDLPGRSVRAGTVLAFDEATGEPVAGPDISSVNGVAGALVAINTVAGSIVDVNTVADNIVDVSNFSGVYYGPSATNPTTRRDGSPLQVGDLYFNTVTNAMRAYNDSAWRDSVTGAVTVQNLSGDGVKTEFLLDYAPESEVVTNVFVNGVYQQKNTYALGGVNGDVLIFDVAPPVGAGNIEVVVSSLTPSDDKLRQELAGESGGNIVGLPRLNGLAGRTVEDFAREKVSINDFYIPSQADWTQGLADAAAYMIAQAQAGTPKVLVFEPGAVYEASSFPNWRWHNIWLEGNNAILRNTGTGDTLIVDAGVDTYSLFNLKIGPFRIEGGPTSGHGCFVRSIHHSVIDVNIRGCGTAKDALHVNFSVCTEFRVAASSNQAAWYSDAKPARGIVLDKRGTGEGVTACYFPNVVVEGVASIGVYLVDADQCSFVGGTSEGNGGANVECLADAWHNTFDGIDLEVTGSGQGFSDYGRWNTWNNIYNDANSTIRAEAVGCTIRGGMHDAIVDNGVGTILDGVRYSIAGGSITTSGNAVGTQQRLRPYNVTTASFGANQLVDLSINGGATIKRHLRISTALNASNLPAPSTVPGAVTLDLTVTGAQVGDIALATFSTAIPSTHLLRAQVVAANTVRITATQVSGAAASIIPSGATIYVDVWGH